MKNTLFSLLLCLPLCGFTQNSFPLFAQKPEWRVYVQSFSSGVVPYRFISDTLFEGKTYSKSIYGSYLVRNEGKKTWIRKLDYYPIQKYSGEFLLYDFGLLQGDSAKVGPQIFGVSGSADSTIRIKVASVDSISVNNKKYKRLKINYPTCGFYTRLDTMYWVEGIGSLSNPFYSAECLCSGCEHSYNLVCFKLDTTQVYLRPGYPSCDYIIIDTKEVNLSQLKIYPNPFINQITLIGTENVQKAYLFDTNGRLIKTINVAESTTVSLTDLPTGLYWLTFFDAKGILLGTRKVVKMNP